MKRKSTALLTALLLMIAMMVLYLFNAPESANQTTSPDPRPGRDMRGPARAAAQAASPDAAEARRVSPPSWTPPGVFAKKALPSPQKLFPRGENASRRYFATENSYPVRTLRSRPPAVLAKSPADGRFHLQPEEIDLHTRLARRMVFDPAALDSIVQGNTSRLIVPTVGAEVLTVEIQSIKTRAAHTHTLAGHVLGEDQSSDVQIVFHDGVIHGTVVRYLTGQELEYRIMADGHMMVREIDPTTMTEVCGNGPESVPDALDEGGSDDGLKIIPQSEGEIVEDSPGWRIIDIVVGYDQGARLADGGYAQIEARIIASVDRMTAAFANSLITNTELMLLGTIEDPNYVFPGSTAGSMSEELNQLNSFTDGVLDSVSDYATQLGADLVCFVPKQTDGSAGIAKRPGRTSIVARTYMTASRITFAHELGHNLGCSHSWGDSSQTYHSHYGWRLEPPGLTRVRTIMAYDWDWGTGTRIPYFANPSVFYNGAATGAVKKYNVQGDATADQRYYQGGLGYSGSNPNLFGFNGTNTALGATNANTINTGGGSSGYGATVASNRSTRAAFSVSSPTAGVQWQQGTVQTISFRGGDMRDAADIQLYKNGVLHSTIASGLNPATQRNFPWALPAGLAGGSDYMIRITLNRNGSVFTADSGIFTVVGVTSHVIAQSPSASPPIIGDVSELVLSFNQAMNPASFSVSDDIISFSGLAASNLKPSITGASWSSDLTDLTLTFTTLSLPGTYQLVLGSQIQDANGRLLDQDRDEILGEPIEDRYLASFEIDSTQSLWSENFDSAPAPGLPSGWTSTSGMGSGAWTVVSTSSHSPSQSAFIPNYETTTSTSLVSPPILISSSASNLQLSFSHAYDLESGFDGGRLEFSVNGGAWFGVDEVNSGASFAANGFNGTVDGLSDKNGWTGNSNGYLQTVVNLTDTAKFAGNSLQIRWLLGTDSSAKKTGWNVDTIQLLGAVPLPSLAVSPETEFAAAGGFGGPFAPQSLEYTLTNESHQPLNWTATKTADWLDLSATSGTLAAGDTTTIIVSIKTSAKTLGVGSYDDTLSFINTTNGAGDTTRGVLLSVNPAAATVTLGNLSQTYDGSSKIASVTTHPTDLGYRVTYDDQSKLPLNADSYEVVATITDPNHEGTASGTLVIAKASQTIDFRALAPVGNDQPPFALTATASSGLAVSYNSSNPAVATVSENTVSIVGPGTTTITASQPGNENYLAAANVARNLEVLSVPPVANPGGPYVLGAGQPLLLNGTASEPSFGAAITSYEWDLNNDGLFEEGITGASPAAIPTDDLRTVYGLSFGLNTIHLRVTDNSSPTPQQAIAEATVFLTNTTRYTGTSTNQNINTWGDSTRWDGGIPASTVDVEITSGSSVFAGQDDNVSVVVGSYNGALTIKSGSLLKVLNSANMVALGTGTVTMEQNSALRLRGTGGQTISNPFVLTGNNVLIKVGESTATSGTVIFSGGFSGAHSVMLGGNNNSRARFTTANAFASLTTDGSAGFGEENFIIEANAAGSLGTGDVSINNLNSLVINAAAAMAPDAQLLLNGATADRSGVTTKLVLNDDLTVTGLSIDGVAVAAGPYTKSSGLVDSGGNALISGDGTLTVTSPAISPYEAWAGGTFAKPFTVIAAGADPDGDGLINLQEFAFGTDPTVFSLDPLTFTPGDDVTRPGLPVALNQATGEGADFHAVFGRRKDFQTAGLRYTVQFSASLDVWVNSNVTPTVLTGENSAAIEAVSLPFPSLIPVESEFKQPNFFRVGVSSN